MNFNLGAECNSNGSTDGTTIFNSYGLYYQWGRKDPFVGPTTYDFDLNDDHTMTNYNGSYAYINYVESTSSEGTLQWASDNPLSIIKGYKENDYELLCRAIKEADAKGISLEEYLKADDMNPKKEDRKYHSLYKAFRILSAANHLCTKAEDYGLGVHSLTWDTAKLPVRDELLPFWAGEYKGLDDFLLEYSNKDIFSDYLIRRADMDLGLKNYLS
jgi:hypothetical protein